MIRFHRRELGGVVGSTSPLRKMLHARFGCGMCLGPWLKLLAEHRFQVNVRYWHMAVLYTLYNTLLSLLGILEDLVFGRAVAELRLDSRPVFVLGHWRSGTTLLHELLALDPQFATPRTFDTALPHAFLTTRSWLPRFISWALAPTRPMDSMPFGFGRPQEDEMALCNLGVPSVFQKVVMGPLSGRDEALNVGKMTLAERERWKRTLLGFLKKVAYGSRKTRLLVKSPGHTARTALLREIFPEAYFIYLVRNPYDIYPSAVNMWQRLRGDWSLQRSAFPDCEEYVFKTFETLDDAFESDRVNIPPSRLCEIKYENMTADPVGTLREIYRHFELGDFERMRPSVERFLADRAGYQKNKFSCTTEERRSIDLRWGRYASRYGYGNPTGVEASTGEGTRR